MTTDHLLWISLSMSQRKKSDELTGLFQSLTLILMLTLIWLTWLQWRVGWLWD